MKLKTLLSFATVAVLLVFGSCHHKDDTAMRLTSEIKAVNKLVLSQMTISKMASISDLDITKAQGLKQTISAALDAVKIGDRKAAYSYDTYMRAYIDLSTLSEDDITIDESAKTISITLPAIKTEFSGRDAELREDHYRVSGLRSQIDANERAELKEKMNTALKREVESDKTFRTKLTESAKMRGKQYCEDLCSRYGYKATVDFK